MKTKQLILLVTLLCLFGSLATQAAMPVVSNVRATQRSGTKLVDIYYDVTGTTNDLIQVSVAVSTNGGFSYTLPATSFTGPGYGASVVPGKHRQIVWDAGADWAGNFSANVSFQVTAGDFAVPANMAYIPAGPFQMGDVLNDFPSTGEWTNWLNVEIPVHTVYVSGFSMDQFEVTKALWDEVHDWATNHGYNFEYEDTGTPTAEGKAPNHPAYWMTWYSAVKWCNARSEMEGKIPAYYTDENHTTVYRTGVEYLRNAWVNWNAGYRLPTEAEWEKAARGGVAGHRFSWADTDTISHSQANYFSDTNYLDLVVSYDVSPTNGFHPDGLIGDWPYTTPVGHFAPNGYGLYDMTGNVQEWCWDWGAWTLYPTSPQTDPHGPDPDHVSGDAHAVRGGYWYGDGALSGAFICRVSYRAFSLSGQLFYCGFRCVLPEGRPTSRVTTVDTRDTPVTISGRVRSAQTGLPLAGAQVTLGGQSVITSLDGSFSLPHINLSAGNTLSIISPGFASVSQIAPVPVGSVQVNIPDARMRFTTVTNRPMVEEIVAAYDGIFISGAPFQNQYGVAVDWNGFTPDRVEYYINNTNSPPVSTVAWSAGSAPTYLEMSEGFLGSHTPGANKLLAVAIDQVGQRSDAFARNIVVIPPPPGLSLVPLQWDPLFDGFLYDPSIMRFKVQVPPKNLLGGFDMAMPLLETLGLHLEGEYKLTYAVPSGVWAISPDGSFLGKRRMEPPYLDWGLWGPRFWANAAATGFATETRGFELDQVWAQLGLEGEACIFRIHFTDWLPPGPALNQVLDAFSYVGVDVNKAQRIDIYGLFGLQADLTWSCRDQRFSEAILTPSGGVKATYGIDLYAASLDTYVQGVLAFPIRVTSPQAWKVTGEVSMGLSVYVWQLVNEDWDYVLLQGDIASSGNWDSQSRVRLPVYGTAGAPVVLEGVLLQSKRTCPRPMGRGYLKAGPAQFLPLDSAAEATATRAGAAPLDNFRLISRALVKGSVAWERAIRDEMRRRAPAPRLKDQAGNETDQVDLTLLQNVFPFARPAIAARGPELMLLYVADNGGSNDLQFTDIEWTRWDGTNWSVPQAIQTNIQAEFMPQVAYDGNGDAIAVWQRVADPNFTNVNVAAMAAQMEIVWSRWNSAKGTWSEPAALTANDHLDNAPMLCGPMASGNVLLAWTENEANLLMGTNGLGADKVLWREWSPASQSWTAPQILVDGLAYRLSQSLAGKGNYAVYAWAQDMDGVLTNDTDQEIFYTIFTNGTWNAIHQFTTNGVPDKNVRLAISAGGDAYLLWERDANLVMSRNFSPTNRLARADSSSAGFADYALSLGPADNLVLLWQGMSTNGSDAYYAVYDPVSDTWSRDDLLSHDAALERSLAPIWDDIGNLTVAYLKQEIVYTNKTVTLEGGGEITLTNVPQRGRVDLMVTKRALVKDLAIDPGNFVVAGQNYLPGDPLTLTAVVQNQGNIAMSNVVVGFYNGNPDAGGVLLSNVMFSGWFEAASTNVASAVWVVPEPAAPHALFAVVNHSGLGSEFNESNNLQSVSIGGTDLAVAFVSYQAETNGAIRVFARVHNLGAPKANGSLLAIRHEGATGTPLATAAVPALEPGQLAQVALDLPAGAQPDGQATYRLFADDNQATSDVNPNNNTTVFVVNLTLDTDGDGLPDWYENQYPFLSATNPADAMLDYDGDRMSNLAEYLAGTAPDDPLSYLRLTSIKVGATSGVRIGWGSVTNKYYTVQRSPALGGTAVFINIAEHILSTPPENHYVDASATNSAVFFYRIFVE